MTAFKTGHDRGQQRKCGAAMTISHAANSGMHPLADRGNDLYETPPGATIALTRAELLPLRVWEPAAGRGAIVNVLRERGPHVVASDLVDYSGLDFVTDFMAVTEMPAGCGCILTNPPFQIVNAFIAHALDLAPRVIFLARLVLLESVTRTEILEYRHLARVHVFRNRLPMMHRGGWQGPRASSSVAYAWFVWDRDHRGPWSGGRITCEAERQSDLFHDETSHRDEVQP
jgi:hypothetical protein